MLCHYYIKSVNYVLGSSVNYVFGSYKYLEIQDRNKLPTSMADIQSRYSGMPYGWREIDIAAVVAQLIYDQRVTVKYAGATIQPNDKKLPDMLRKKSEIGKTSISKRRVLSLQNMKSAREFMRQYFDVMDVPNDEDGLVRFIVEKFSAQKQRYSELDGKYTTCEYPDHALLTRALSLINDVLSQQKDNEALVKRLIAKSDALFDSKDDMAFVEAFFSTQVGLFDKAAAFEMDMRNDGDYLAHDADASKSLNAIRLILMIPQNGRYNYKRIPELNALMDLVRISHERMLTDKRKDQLEIVYQCMEEIHRHCDENETAKKLSNKADEYFTQCKEKIAGLKSLALLDGMAPPMWQYKDDILARIEETLRPATSPEEKSADELKPVKKIIMPIYRQSIFPAKRLTSEAEIDIYVEQMRKQLIAYLKGSDGIELK